MIHIVLVEPEIPGNTGNIARTCAVLGARLHLVEPLGFSIDEKHIKRAGLDYWDKLDIATCFSKYNDIVYWVRFFDANAGGEFYYFSTKAKRRYSEVRYHDGCYLIFGKETKGLPEELVYGNPDTAVRLPMRDELRSLNLANSVCAAAYEVMRQLDYPGLR